MDTKKFAFLPYIPPKFVRCHFFVSWDSMENRTHKNILLSDKKYLCGNKQKKLEKVLFSDKKDSFKSVRQHENVIWDVVDAINGVTSQINMESDKKNLEFSRFGLTHPPPFLDNFYQVLKIFFTL